jgi:hypothetical protein
VKDLRRDRIVVFIGFGPKSQGGLKRLNLMLDMLRNYYDVTIVHVPDDSISELPYIRIEPGTNLGRGQSSEVERFDK